MERLFTLVHLIIFQYLTGLSMQYNRMGCEGLTVLAPAITRLKALTGLDLSCNNMSFIYDHTRAELLGETLASLPKLRRLDLSNNRIKNKLSAVLTRIEQTLTHLELSACGLSDLDLQYLTRSNHVRHLQGLDISENNLGKHFEHFCELLQAAGKNLIVLETEDCCLDQTHFTHLSHITCKNLFCLRFWNLSRNVAPLNVDTLLEDMKAMITMPHLETFLVSYPAELVPDDIAVDDVCIETRRQTYQQRLHTALNKLCENISRKPLNVVLVNS